MDKKNIQKRGGLIAPEITDLLKQDQKDQKIKEFFKDMHAFDIFVLCEDLEDFQVAEIIKALGIPDGILFFEEFDDERKKDIFECFNKEWMAGILEEMAHDERVDFIKNLTEDKAEEILPLVARAERLDIKKLMNYEEGTAGSIMTTDYAYLPPHVSARAALEKVKLQAFDRETIYYLYVIDDDRKLLGFISLRDILVASPNKIVRDIMNPNVIFAHLADDREKVANMLNDYGFLAIPITDNQDRLVGIVTVDDVMEVVEEEVTEDIYRLGAAGEYVDYMKSNPFVLARQRTTWLLLLIFVGFLSAYILDHESATLEAMVALSFFIPLLLGAGGNAGTQSSTVIIRGIATEEIKTEHLLRVVRKELSVGMIVGTFMAVLGGCMALWLQNDVKLGITVGTAMIATVILATSLGALLPITFKKMKLDPALMSGPFITSIVDIVSLLIYFKIAAVILNVL